MVSFRENMDVVRRVNDEFRFYGSALSLCEIDQWSALPLEGGAYRQAMTAFLRRKQADLLRGDDAARAAKFFEGMPLSEIEDSLERGLVRGFLRQYRLATRVPEDLSRRFDLMRTDVMRGWLQAREAKDFRVFQPWMEKAFRLKGEMARALAPDVPVFDTLIDLTDEGLDSTTVARVFDVLKAGLLDLMDRIGRSKVSLRVEIQDHKEDPSAMARFGRQTAAALGYDRRQGHFSHDVVHGFSSSLGPRDARVSTNLGGGLSMLFTCLHETGHSLYSTGGSDAVNVANLWGGIRGGFHEGNARFYENVLGRSSAFWHWCLPRLREEFPFFAGFSENEFFGGVNAVRPSLRRMDADEVTYCLHVMVRFDLERALFAGDLAFDDVPEAWNAGYERLLGISPENDTEGVLQDMHWAGDFIGYFQSYALGCVYDGMFAEALERDVPDIWDHVAQGDFSPLNGWMKEHIWRFGRSLTSQEVLRSLGYELDARPFLRYLVRKYSSLYEV